MEKSVLFSCPLGIIYIFLRVPDLYMLSHEDYYNMKYILKDKKITLKYISGTWVPWFFAINEQREEIEEEIREDREDTCRRDYRRDWSFQKVQIPTLEMMEVPDSQNGNMVKTQTSLINEVLLTSNFRTDKYLYGKVEFPRIKIFKTEISVLILTDSNLSSLKYWYETTY